MRVIMTDNNTQHLSADMIADLARTWEDAASVIKSRGIKTYDAVAVVGSVSAMVRDLTAAGFRAKSNAVYGYVVGAGRAIVSAGFDVKSKNVSAAEWKTLAGHVERAGSKPFLAAVKDVVSPLGDVTTTDDARDRLEAIMTAVAALPTRKSRGARGAGGKSTDESDTPAGESGAGENGATESGAYTPQDGGTVRAMDAIADHIRAALDLIETGAPVSDRARALVVRLSEIMAVDAASVELEMA